MRCVRLETATALQRKDQKFSQRSKHPKTYILSSDVKSSVRRSTYETGVGPRPEAPMPLRAGPILLQTMGRDEQEEGGENTGGAELERDACGHVRQRSVCSTTGSTPGVFIARSGDQPPVMGSFRTRMRLRSITMTDPSSTASSMLARFVRISIT